MSRLVFGESLSPDEIRRVRRASVSGDCVRFGVRFNRQPRDVLECGRCRYRDECGIRKDDRVRAEKILSRIALIVRDECRGGDRCCDFPWCDHVPEYLWTTAEREKWLPIEEE